MPRTSAENRLRRLLAVVPWVAAHDGPTVEEVCARFGLTEADLLADLDLLWLCGLYPYTPDVLIEVDIADGRVWIRYADFFRRPLRLTAAEGLALLSVGAALLAVPGADRDGPLARGLTKLAVVLGVEPDETVEVELAPVPADVLAIMHTGVADHRQVQIDYYSFGRDDRTVRVIDPRRVFNAAGQWYVEGFCHRAGGERLFRVDRVHRAELLESTFDPGDWPDDGRGDELSLYSPRSDDPVVTLELAPRASWVADHYPVERVESGPDGGLRVTMRVSEQAWLERLLLRLGPDADVVEGDPDLARQAANRLLVRYGVSDAATSNPGSTLATP
jgi:proteasome accessory factor C